MMLLAIDTSTDRTSVALLGDDGLVASASLGVPRSHGAFLAPAIAGCLRSAGLVASDVTGVAVGLGPGRYTGLRVGIATAQAFALARDLPTVGRSGLEVIASGFRHSGRPIVAVIDARRRELFRARFVASAGQLETVGEPAVGSIDDLLAEVAACGPEVLVVGEGALALRSDLEAAGAEVAGPELAWPDADRLAALARDAFVRGDTVHAAALQPIYLRGVDARIGWETRGRLQGGSAT
ncbi:MAG: tRNA ((37)-N6)-threonylcarbamoyltransferase complex dimerization subunit type 1 TsaB [Actinomycetota bacterium]|jgi:tRNA threonylcarbamoyladenosine biosynthesis protein TsaB